MTLLMVESPAFRTIALLLLSVSCRCGTNPETREDDLLRKAILSRSRPIEGRLSVYGPRAPWTPASAASENHQVETARTSTALANQQVAILSVAHRSGLLDLYRGAIARGVKKLESISREQPTPAVLSDLSAAYIALAEDDRPWLYLDAIAAARLAAEKAPTDPASAFNLALAFEKASLTRAASRAFRVSLAIETDRGWRDEIARRLARLHRPRTLDHWEAEKASLIEAAKSADGLALSRLVRKFPRECQRLLDVDLIPAWGQDLGTPAEGRRQLVLQRIAQALATSGERFYVDVLRAALSHSRSIGSRHRLAVGIEAYAHGLEARQDCSLAEPEFARATNALESEHNPLAFATQLERLVCLHRRLPHAAERPLALLAGELEHRPYPTLRAKVERMRGLSSLAQGRISEAIGHYQSAALFLRSIGDSDAAVVEGMLDEAYRFLGDRESSWHYRMRALRSAIDLGDRRLRHLVLAGLARELVATGRMETAAVVLDEMLANARAWPEPGAEAETLLRRIQLNLAIGDTQQAAEDLAACLRILPQYRQPAARKRLETELEVARAEFALVADPRRAAAEIASTLTEIHAADEGLLLPRALLVKARASLAIGDDETTQKALEESLRLFETRRSIVGGEEQRINFFATAQSSFDEMIRFEALNRGDALAALDYAEQTRSRGLRERIQGNPLREASLTERLRLLPTRTVALAFAVLPENLLIWRCDSQTLHMYVQKVSRQEVADLVSKIRSALRRGESGDALAVASKGFDLLLRPALEGQAEVEQIVFVPDRELYEMPFAALYDAKRGRFVVEDYISWVSPSLGLYLDGLGSKAPPSGAIQRALVVGDPAFDAEKFPTLSPLPAARREAEAIARSYPQATLLVGRAATRESIIAALHGSNVLHLASHVLIDEREPLASIVATAAPDSVLRAGDLSRSGVSKLDLAFLAGCDTAPGFGDGDREGVAGLARAFLAAGVPAVVATLWAVSDREASSLPLAFHVRLLHGESSAQALRGAQLASLSSHRVLHSFTWASFQLYLGKRPQEE